MNTAKDFVDAVRAGYAFFYVNSLEGERDIEEMVRVLKEYAESPDGQKFEPYPTEIWSVAEADGASPVDALDKLESYPARTVMFLHNYHWFFDKSIEGEFFLLVQRVLDKASFWRSPEGRKIMVIVSPVPMRTGLPKELQRVFFPIKFALPTEEDLGKVLDYVVDSAGKAIPSEMERKALVDSALGMTRQEAENAYSFSFVQSGKLDCGLVGDINAAVMEETVGLKYIKPTVSFKDVVGFNVLKDFALSTINSDLCLGLLFVGPPGGGKTLFMNALGYESGYKVYELEFASLFGSLLGETEERVASVIDRISAQKNCLVLIDEIEKGLSGVKGNGSVSSNEVAKRAMAQWLKFMSNRPPGIKIFGTSNDIRSLPPEYLRAERWDTAPFYIGLPNWEERDSLIAFYMEKFNVSGNLDEDETVGWTGAEIKAICRIAAMRKAKVQDVKKFIRPLSLTMKEEIQELERWAKDRAIPASILEEEKKLGKKHRRTLDV
jgi:hypothetical protein